LTKITGSEFYDENFKPILEFYRSITESFVVPNRDGSASIYYKMTPFPDTVNLKDFEHYRTYPSVLEAEEANKKFENLKKKARKKWQDVSKKLTSSPTTI
jgi:hypothetical protein